MMSLARPLVLCAPLSCLHKHCPWPAFTFNANLCFGQQAFTEHLAGDQVVGKARRTIVMGSCLARATGNQQQI